MMMKTLIFLFKPPSPAFPQGGRSLQTSAKGDKTFDFQLIINETEQKERFSPAVSR